MGRLFSLAAKFLSGGSKVATVGAGAAAAGVAGDYALTGGSNVKSALSGVMETLGISQASAGLETGFFSLYKTIDELVEAFVGFAGRSPATDFMRKGLQGMMKLTPDQMEMGSLNRPETLSNPSSKGYIGGKPTPGVAAPVATTEAPTGTVAAVDPTAPAPTPEAPSVTSSPEAFMGSLKADFLSVMQPRVVNGQTIEGDSQLNWAAVGSGTGNNLKALQMGWNNAVAGTLGGGIDLVNMLDNVTGANWIPDSTEGGYMAQMTTAMQESTTRTQNAYLGGAVDTDKSALAATFNFAGNAAPLVMGGGIPVLALKAGTTYQGLKEAADTEIGQSVQQSVATWRVPNFPG